MYWQSWKYKNLSVFAGSLVIALGLFFYEPFHLFLLHLGSLGYVGTFLTGILFVSTFTVATGIVILLSLSQTISPLTISIVAGFGAVVGDVIIFRFVKDNLLEEIMPLYKRLGGNHLSHVLHSRYFSWTLPVLGALIIASPLPDELGVSLMGISKMKTYHFLILSFLLNSLGIFFVVSVSRL